MDDFDKYLKKQLKNPAFKKEWDNSETEYQLMMMVLKARNEQCLTQSELAERTESGNPILAGLKKGSPCLLFPH